MLNQKQRAVAIAEIFTELWPDVEYRIWHWQDRSEASARSNFPLNVPATQNPAGPSVRIHEKEEITVSWFSTTRQKRGFVIKKTAKDAIAAVREVGL